MPLELSDRLRSKRTLRQGIDPFRGLGLTRADRRTLRSQGFVSSEIRTGRNQTAGPVFKLRWRLAGRQRVRYLGRDTERAAAISAALDVRRRDRQVLAQLEQLLRTARLSLRRARLFLTRKLESAGRRWHGYQARSARTAKPNLAKQDDSRLIGEFSSSDSTSHVQKGI